MKRFSAFVTGALLAMLVVAPIYAQQPTTPKDPHPTRPGEQGATAGGMMPMEMCREMMAGHMMGGMMSMPMGGDAQQMDPKTRAQMLEMRGEMMKAMGDIMMKHARRMQGPTSK